MRTIRAVVVSCSLLGLGMGGVSCGSQAAVPEGDNPVATAVGASGKDTNQRGIMEYQKRNWERAENYFRAAIAANPELAEAHYNLGLVLDKKGAHDQAAESFQQAVDIGSTKWALAESVIVKDHIGM